MTDLRSKALELIQTRNYPSGNPEFDQDLLKIFGSHVFSVERMSQYLDSKTFKKIKSVIDQGRQLERDLADKVANAMKIWAVEQNVAHYTHWFQPLTGLNAEKHDSFLDFENGKPILKLSGSSLAQQEPDASSFPSGGMRNTFEARGYTAWDPSSPAFILENKFGKTLCIPTIFVSFTGEPLDYKAPLLKSLAAIDEAAVAVCKLIDPKINKIIPTLGAEQEYFLIDEALYALRPDLVMTGRTLLGQASAKDHQLDDHYFGAIPERVSGFMKELEIEAFKLGIPLKTRHNEVAPGQYECAPIFEELNVAVDHNQILVDLIHSVARNHKFRALLHEKPFAGVNGSGKHNNWSLSTDTGKNLLSPGVKPKDNLLFLTVFINVIKAVFEHADLLRASIASAGNDHRLGANEAPPAIISIFIGRELTRLLEEIEKPKRSKKNEEVKTLLKLGISKIPEIFLDNTDRNRTSPFAFTGNKFEFRAVGSSANNALPMIVLNTIVADQLNKFNQTVKRKTTRGKQKDTAILEVLRTYIKESKNILFEGNGYGKEWEIEAESRGLSNLKNTPLALDAYTSPKTVDLFVKNGLFSERELEARQEIKQENYVMRVQIEARVLGDLIKNHIIPAAIRYQNIIMENISKAKEIGLTKESQACQLEIAQELGTRLNKVYQLVNSMVDARRKANGIGEMREKALNYAENVTPFFDKIRYETDRLERIIDDELWPLPKYRELFFVK